MILEGLESGPATWSGNPKNKHDATVRVVSCANRDPNDNRATQRLMPCPCPIRMANQSPPLDKARASFRRIKGGTEKPEPVS